MSVLATVAVLVFLGGLFHNQSVNLAEAFPKRPKDLPGKNMEIVPRPLSQKAFHNIGCSGKYDKFAYSLTERICDDCYDLYQELDLLPLCRSDCFHNAIFRLCLKATVVHKEARFEYLEAAAVLNKRKQTKPQTKQQPKNRQSKKN